MIIGRARPGQDESWHLVRSSGFMRLKILQEFVDSFPVNLELGHVWGRTCVFVWYVGKIFLCKFRLELFIKNVDSGLCVHLWEIILIL